MPFTDSPDSSRGDTVAVLDFETTGVSVTAGDRATELAIVLVRDGRIVDRFQSLMHTGVPIPWHIQRLTGITDEMTASAPPAAQVMRDAAAFVGNAPMVAHNAGFDRRFWGHECGLAGVPDQGRFACTLLLSRRLYPDAPSHKLGALADHLGLPRSGPAHRALADTEMAAHLWLRMVDDLQERHGCAALGHERMVQLQGTPAGQCRRLLARWAEAAARAASGVAVAA
jgi:DNA polymerase-3 subunit epsilon